MEDVEAAFVVEIRNPPKPNDTARPSSCHGYAIASKRILI